MIIIGGGAGLVSHNSTTNNNPNPGQSRGHQDGQAANNSGNHYNQSRRGPSLQNRGAAILGGLPLHQASMIAQESRLMHHQDDEMAGSMYSGSFGGGRTPIGASSINGIGLAPITRTNTVSLHNNQQINGQIRNNPQNPYVTGSM